MTRTSLSRTMRRSYLILVLVLVVSLVAKLAEHVPGLAGTPIEKPLKDIYEYMKDMALVFVTVVAAYLANVFQRRQMFVTALKEEWKEIIRAKSALYTYTQLDQPELDDYLKAFCAISETIDNMRTVYENVGETTNDIGLYPYAPLHDMRRAFQTLEPRKHEITPEQRKLVRDAILQSFYAVREGFLGELDLESPENPILIFGARRLKKAGQAEAAGGYQRAQAELYDRIVPPKDDGKKIYEFLKELHDKEQNTGKAWRQVANGANGVAPATGRGPERPDDPSAPLT